MYGVSYTLQNTLRSTECLLVSVEFCCQHSTVSENGSSICSCCLQNVLANPKLDNTCSYMYTSECYQLVKWAFE